MIPSIDYDSSGHYVCTVVNTIGNTSYSVDSSPVPLTVRGPPAIKDGQRNKVVKLGVGTSSDIRIPFCSFPPPTTAWLLSIPGHKDQRVTLLGDSSYDRFSASIQWEDSVGHCYEAVLHIQFSDLEDSGSYTLELENTDGGIKYNFDVVVVREGDDVQSSMEQIFKLCFITIFILTICKFLRVVKIRTVKKSNQASYV